MTWTLVATVASFTSPEKRYDVKTNDDGLYGCACMAYRFNRETPKRCKHIDAVRAGTAMDIVVTARDVPPLPAGPRRAIVESDGEMFSVTRAIR